MVVADWMMPGIDGLELCRKVRAMEDGTYVHILLLTSKSSQEDLLTAFEAGVDDFLSKPVQAEELRSRLTVGRRLLNYESELSRKVTELQEALAEVQSLSGLLLGSVTVTWLLGHAYLTATRMTIAPLGHFSRVLLWALAVRGGFLLLSIAVAWTTSNNAAPPILTRITDAWIVVLLRVGVGLVAVGVFALMVRACVRLRATQSATGILYFGSLFAYIGELANQHLVVAWAWPM